MVTSDEAVPDPARFLAALLDSLSVGVVACDDTGRIVLVNRAVREILDLPESGASAGDYARLAAEAVYDADGRPLAPDRAVLRRARRGERVEHVDIQIRIPGRRTRIFATTARPVEGPHGRPLGAVAVAHEITAIRRAERFRACHRAVEQYLRTAGTVADAAPGILEAICTTLGWLGAELWLHDEAIDRLESVGRWSAPGTDLGAVLSQPVLRGAGLTGRIWATGQPIWVPDIAATTDLLSGAELERTQACLRQGIRAVLGVPVHDGETLLGVLNCFAGAPEHHEDLLTVLLDGVAAQIGVYLALRRAEELAGQLGRAKDDFIALVGHEIRTPLTSIVANAAMLAEEGGDLDDERRRMVGAVARNAAALHDVVDTLLDLAGLDSGQLGLVSRRVDLAGIVTDALDAARAAGAVTGVRLGPGPSGPVWLDGDPERLRQVVDDLLANAVRYTGSGGDVTVHLTENDGRVELRIADTGIGVPVGERDRVFERFHRGGNVRHQGTSGPGLGLSRVRTIVHRHGGTVRLVENRPHGTTVLVVLPR